MDEKFDFDDILLVPSVLSNIESRYNDIVIKNENNMLPIFTAPMIDVLTEKNHTKFLENNIYCVIPRGHGLNVGNSSLNKFLSFSLDEFIERFIKSKYDEKNDAYILIDIANGHQKRLINIIIEAKKIYGDKLHLMVGNIANPQTYVELSNAGADYIRCGIGAGSACTTTANGAIGYPMASLIKEIYDLSCKLNKSAKIVADGGMRKYSDIIKALALGADYVMIGGMFNKMLESSGVVYKKNGFNKMVISKNPENDFNKKIQLYRNFRGMSSKSIQRELGVKNLKTSEGVEKYNKIKWSLPSWVENFEHYLRSNMSYCDSTKLDDYIGKVQYIKITPSAYKRFDK